VVAHRRKQGVRLIITTTKTEQKWTEHTIRDQLGNCVRYISRSNLSKYGWSAAEVYCLSGLLTGKIQCRRGMTEDWREPAQGLLAVDVREGERNEL
jgi:hypothetical protein